MTWVKASLLIRMDSSKDKVAGSGPRRFNRGVAPTEVEVIPPNEVSGLIGGDKFPGARLELSGTLIFNYQPMEGNTKSQWRAIPKFTASVKSQFGLSLFFLFVFCSLRSTKVGFRGSTAHAVKDTNQNLLLRKGY